jgi:hypothetical protein
MKPVLKAFAFLAVVGFAVSVVSHLCALFGVAGPLGDQSWVLHVGIFVVWIPAVLAGQSMGRNVPSKDFWKAALRGCPAWMRYTTYFFFGYAIFNFLLFILTAPSGVETAGSVSPSMVRGLSGHWMAFYGAAFSILYSKARTNERDHPSRCPNGHPIGPFAKFCEACGSPVGPASQDPQ